ncbi:MAG: DNA alkylation repair protein [Alistipes sp.]|nr:DNA alkylation repair protein [Alistipes sp.]
MFEQKKRLLLYRLRKEMNGAALDYMRYYGADYERNYGVQIYALRDIAQQIGCDDDFARYLYADTIREVRLVGAWIADAERVTTEDFDFWGRGVINSEVAEQLAHALMSRISAINELLDEWCAGNNALLAYTALLAASRNQGVDSECAVRAVLCAVNCFSDNALIVRGASALAMTLSADRVSEILAQLPQSPTATALREEIAWLCE